MKKMVNLTLPPFAWLLDDELAGRNVILHIRSSLVIEILNTEQLLLNPEAICKEFNYGGKELIAIVHHSPLLEDVSVDEVITKAINPAIEYYKTVVAKQKSTNDAEARSQMN